MHDIMGVAGFCLTTQSSTSATDREKSSKIAQNAGDPTITKECFLCERPASGDALRQAMMMKLNERINECAKTLGEGGLLAKLSAWDVVAQDKVPPYLLGSTIQMRMSPSNCMKVSDKY